MLLSLLLQLYRKSLSPSILFFLFKVVLSILSSLHFHVHLELACQYLQKTCWYFQRNCVESTDQFGEKWNLDTESWSMNTIFTPYFSLFLFGFHFIGLAYLLSDFSLSILSFDAITNGIIKISISDHLLLIYRNIIHSAHWLCLQPWHLHLLVLVVLSVDSIRFLTQISTLFVNEENLITSFLMHAF